MSEQNIANNQDMTYTQKRIFFSCKSEQLNTDVNQLRKEFPHSADLAAPDAVERLMRGIFGAEVQTAVYIRNLSTDAKKVAGIRPVIYGDGDYLLQQLGAGHSILVKGYPRGREFVVQHLQSTVDTDLLPYEAHATIVPCGSSDDVRWNFIDELLTDTVSVVAHTNEQLREWDEAIDWMESIRRRSMYGGRYYRVAIAPDEEDGIQRIQFDVVFPDEKSCKQLVSKKDCPSIVGLEWSRKPWRYEFAGFTEEGQNGRERSRKITWPISLGSAYVKFIHPAGERDGIPEEAVKALYQPFVAQIVCEIPSSKGGKVNAAAFLRKLPEEGFLTIVAPELWTMRRMRQSSIDLKEGRTSSPNLALWMFDVTKARLPREEDKVLVTEWKNKSIAENDSQRKAVEKMLNAPDVCLIQGPPGTGKTDMIAEAIYQFTKRGQRVLLASQSNDAVDNALSRLPKEAGIRCIRSDMTEGGHKRGENNPFSQHNVLSTFYSETLGGHVNRMLSAWKKLDRAVEVPKNDLQAVERLQKELSYFESALNQKDIELLNVRRELLDMQEARKSLQEMKVCIQQERNALNALQQCLLGDDDQKVYLSKRQAAAIEEALGKMPKMAAKHGILMEAEINHAIATVRTIDGLVDRLENNWAQGEASEDEKQLQERLLRLNAEMPSPSETGRFNSWLEEVKEVRLRLDTCKCSQGSIISLWERKFLQSEQLARLQKYDRAALTEIREGAAQIRAQLRNMAEALNNLVDSSTDVEERLKSNKEHTKAIEGRQKSKTKERQEYLDSCRAREEQLQEICQRYQAEGIDERLNASIKRAIEQAEFNRQASGTQGIREDWESLLAEYHDRLVDRSVADGDKDLFYDTYRQSCNVVGTSCTADMGTVRKMGPFDVVIIDEVSKATPPELLMPLLHARKAVLVGDHRQLPPLFGEHQKSYEELCRQEECREEDKDELLTMENFQRFKRLITASMFKEAFEKADDSIRQSLMVQYRMHPDIMEVTNRFYDNQLACGLSREEADRKKSHGITLRGFDQTELLTPEKHAIWIDSTRLPDGQFCAEVHPEKRFVSSLENPMEQRLILQTVLQIAADCKQRKVKKELGIIFFYYAQVAAMRNMLRNIPHEDLEYVDIAMDTVDRFQGREKNIVIVGLTRNKVSSQVGEHVISFERINVAFSRAQELLIIVGAKGFFERLDVPLPKMYSNETVTTKVYQNIVEQMRNKGCLAGPEKLLKLEDVNYLHDFYQKRMKVHTVADDGSDGRYYHETGIRKAV